MKTCIRCKAKKSIDCFYKHRAMSDGRLGKCKECCRISSIENRVKKIDYYREYDRNRYLFNQDRRADSFYRKKHLGKDKNQEYTKRWSDKSRTKRNAHLLVKRAIENGKIERLSCKICGHIKAHAHHEDYSKPLDVIFLCSAHHSRRHREIRERERCKSIIDKVWGGI